VGEAFQLRDDVLDGDEGADAAAHVDDLLSRAARTLVDAPLRPDGADALIEIAELLRSPSVS
jgi:plasmid stabilization system protein ParE